jgi:hypothetical protein
MDKIKNEVKKNIFEKKRFDKKGKISDE